MNFKARQALETINSLRGTLLDAGVLIKLEKIGDEPISRARNAINVTIYVKRDKIDMKGDVPIYCMLRHLDTNTMATIYTRLKVDMDTWARTNKLKSGRMSKEEDKKYRQLENIRIAAISIAAKFIDMGESFNAMTVRDELVNDGRLFVQP